MPAQRRGAALCPDGAGSGAQILEPVEGPASMGLLVQRGDECAQVVADVHRHLRIGKHAPHGTRQILVTQLRDPAPSGIVDRQRQARMEYAARLFRKAASGKIDVTEFGVGETAAR
jgi:hypothetical protein